MKLAALLAIGCLFSFQKSMNAQSTPDAPKNAFRSGQVWLDESGKPIESHLGGILFDKGVYYWYGMNFDGPTLAPGTVHGQGYSWFFNKGVTIYSSTDLYHWTRVGTALAEVSYKLGDLLQPLNGIVRPKVIKNDTTGKYVMMAQLFSPDFKSTNDVIVAVADAPAGPFQFRGKLKWQGAPNMTGMWEATAKDLLEKPVEAPDRIRAFDIGLYKDDDGKGYLITAHHDAFLYELSDDYLTVKKVSKMEGISGEAPALFKWSDTYFLLTSGLSGWAPNQNTYATAPSIHGPWTPRGPFAEGPKQGTTFDSQVTFVLPIQGKPDAFIFMADRMNATKASVVPDLSKMTHVWLPIQLNASDKSLKVIWQDEWDLSVFK